jgi:hypothetical protein
VADVLGNRVGFAQSGAPVSMAGDDSKTGPCGNCD